ncbi:hypothetical protein KIL84_018837, partial [Mauremys mutica]
MATHRSSWLQASALPCEVQSTIQDMPFESASLFLEQMDSKFHGLKDIKVTLKSLGLYTPAPVRKHYQPQQMHQFSIPPPRQDLLKKRSRGYRLQKIEFIEAALDSSQARTFFYGFQVPGNLINCHLFEGLP